MIYDHPPDQKIEKIKLSSSSSSSIVLLAPSDINVSITIAIINCATRYLSTVLVRILMEHVAYIKKNRKMTNGRAASLSWSGKDYQPLLNHYQNVIFAFMFGFSLFSLQVNFVLSTT